MALSFAGTGENSAINGGTVTITFSASACVTGNYVVVTYATPVTPGTGMSVRSSVVGDTFTQILATTASTVNAVVMSIWAKKLGTPATVQAVCTGTGNSSDGDTAVGIILADDGKNPQLDTAVTVQTGSGTTPDSPSITVVTSNDIVMSCVAAAISDTTVTAPTSFTNQADINASDTRSTTTGMAIITLNSTSAFDPGTWTNFTSAGWVGATVAIRPGSTALTNFPFKDDLQAGYRNPVTMVAY